MRTVPYNSYLKQQLFNLETQEQAFEVIYRGTEFSDPVVVTITIGTDNTIQILRDRRRFFKSIIREERKAVTKKGFGAERRFLKEANIRTKRTPKWFIGVFQASRAMDQNGIDAFAHIKVPGVQNTVRVPIQIKSSMLGIEHYAEKRPEYIKAGVLIFAISDDVTDVQIRNQLLMSLRAIRATRTDPYKEFLESITAQL